MTFDLAQPFVRRTIVTRRFVAIKIDVVVVAAEVWFERLVVRTRCRNELIVLRGIHPSAGDYDHDFGIAMRKRRIQFANPLHGTARDMVTDKHSRIVRFQHRVDQFLRPLFDHAVLGVGANAMTEGHIVNGLQYRVILHHDTVDHWRANFAQRRQLLFASRRVTVVNNVNHDYAIAVRCRSNGGADIHFVRQAFGPLSIKFQDVPRLGRGPDDAAGKDIAIERMQLIFERGGHAEIATATTDCPEQIGVLVGTDAANLAIGRYKLCASDIVDGQTVFAVQPPKPATQRVAAHARV